jgi:nucleoid-associated protein YgaU
VAVTTVGLVARLTRAARLVQIADALSLAVVRNVLQGALGVTLAAGVVAASSGPVPVSRDTTSSERPTVSVTDDRGAEVSPIGADVGAATVVALGGDTRAGMTAVDEPSGRAEMVAIGDEVDRAEMIDADAPRAEMVAIDADAPRAEMVAIDDAPPAQMSWLGPPGASAVAEDDPATSATEHEVVGGDHLWNIAERTVADHLGRAPEDREVAAYWERLIEVNRDRLADPDNPDLLFPGQVVQLPDPGSGSVAS